MKKLEVSQGELKKHLFGFFPSLRQYPDKYLSHIFRNPADATEHMAYLCPLCLKNFIYCITTQIRWSETFSLDHFPPESVNGRSTILVCKPCNNNAGETYESKVKEIIENECFNRKIPNSSINSSVMISEVRGWHKGKFWVNESGEYGFKLTTNQTKNLPELAKWNSDPVGDWEMKATINHINEVNFSKTLLKAAYLYCFSQWGYSFAFSTSGELMRKSFIGQQNYPIKVPFIWFDNKSKDIDFNSIIPGVVFLAEPKKLQSIFVNIPIELVELKYKCIIPIQIPNPSSENLTQLLDVNKQLLSQKVTVKIAPINLPPPAMVDSFSNTWSALLKQFENVVD